MVSSSVILFFLWENLSPFSPVGHLHAHQKGSINGLQTIPNLCINTDCKISHNAFGMQTSRGSVFVLKPLEFFAWETRNTCIRYTQIPSAKLLHLLQQVQQVVWSLPCAFFWGNIFHTTLWRVLLLVHIWGEAIMDGWSHNSFMGGSQITLFPIFLLSTLFCWL